MTSTAEALHRTFRTTNPTTNVQCRWNLAPGQAAPVIRRHPTDGRHLSMLSWGMVPHTATDPLVARLINAEAETLATAPVLRGAYARRRCLVPANAWYDWINPERPREAVAFARHPSQLLAFAGLWEAWRGPGDDTLRSFAIITRASSGASPETQRRMPLILPERDWPTWLGETSADPAPLLTRDPPSDLIYWWMGTAINDVRSEGAELLARPARRATE